ncbi:hypothetical protein BDP81DRAFT_428401 [Colletotrichum phormii]|uniref:Secreted protein n=1 Tax=Colletotrichum phormii TaxID=359342 RepID=A0AAI9ZTZ5_9PEZI|nr:uncharacterized protein BDP81DRAFT_428401 [Colletotrichum phormii]KAK1636809.1 hypothetical protein BDP81DRAFT_428401 [Colletotrichum phormii]
MLLTKALASFLLFLQGATVPRYQHQSSCLSSQVCAACHFLTPPRDSPPFGPSIPDDDYLFCLSAPRYTLVRSSSFYLRVSLFFFFFSHSSLFNHQPSLLAQTFRGFITCVASSFRRRFLFFGTCSFFLGYLPNPQRGCMRLSRFRS